MGGSVDMPPGWVYNPSAWRVRRPLISGAGLGLLIALYLGAYQLGYVPRVWYPLFGAASSETVLNSSIARKLPVPDALLGVISYLLDIIGGSLGDNRRWKTSPWHVISFGFVVGAAGITSLVLIVSQPVFLGAWCTLCLLSAIISILLVKPAIKEVLASLRYLKRVKQSGFSVWKALWGDNQISSTVG